MNQTLVDTQVARDSALQRLAALASSVGPQACATAGVDTVALEGDAVVRGHLERIAVLEREVGAARCTALCRAVLYCIQDVHGRRRWGTASGAAGEPHVSGGVVP